MCDFAKTPEIVQDTPSASYEDAAIQSEYDAGYSDPSPEEMAETYLRIMKVAYGDQGAVSAGYGDIRSVYQEYINELAADESQPVVAESMPNQSLASAYPTQFVMPRVLQAAAQES